MEHRSSKKRTHPHPGFATRSCFNQHEVLPHQLRTVAIGGALVLVCSNECEAQAHRRIVDVTRARTTPQRRG